VTDRQTSHRGKKVEELICSQEGEPSTHKSPREIERITGIHRSLVQRMVKKDLVMRSYKRIVSQKLNDDSRIKRLQRCQLLLQRFPTERSTGNIWFTDEKTFSVATLLTVRMIAFIPMPTERTSILVV